jgi:hypothetical protein
MAAGSRPAAVIFGLRSCVENLSTKKFVVSMNVSSSA